MNVDSAQNGTTHCHSFYIVEPGDHCYAIGRAHGVGVDDIVAMNPSLDSECHIFPGDAQLQQQHPSQCYHGVFCQPHHHTLRVLVDAVLQQHYQLWPFVHDRSVGPLQQRDCYDDGQPADHVCVTELYHHQLDLHAYYQLYDVGSLRQCHGYHDEQSAHYSGLVWTQQQQQQQQQQQRDLDILAQLYDVSSLWQCYCYSYSYSYRQSARHCSVAEIQQQ
ncbi:hypothetical protein P8C59_009242 [Phyllachora maydis]|uniref:LysM domain-containing protein n=1 Tax=Phyllachora maydis TaxID=1825666 RepID=A0AAD9ICR4_9PEZI|nr:hypothetical protein P8C59_009242 [Phyllachora maydis]